MTAPKEDAPRSELELTPARMMELAELAARLVVDRFEALPGEPAWRGGSRAELEPIMKEPPPEDGRPPEEAVQARVIETGTAMMSSTRLRGLYSLRLCILNHNTTCDDVHQTLAAIERFGAEAVAEAGG